MEDKKTCDHKNFWQIYVLMNTKKIWKNWGVDFECQKCKRSCNALWERDKECENKKFLQKIVGCFLWMLPALILIWGVIIHYIMLLLNPRDLSPFMVVLPAIVAIILIILFHFGAMYHLFKSKRLVITEKKLEEAKKSVFWWIKDIWNTKIF